MSKTKLKFTHFDNGVNTKQYVRTYLGNLNISEFLDDVEADIKIVDGDIEFELINKQYYSEGEITDIMNCLKELDWDNGYEYIQLFDNVDGIVYHLVGDRPSGMADIINSPQNTENIRNFGKQTGL